MVPPVSRFHAFAAAVAFFVGGYSSIFASALDLEIADCSGVAHMPTGSMTEDVNVFLCDATSFKCEEVRKSGMHVLPSGTVSFVGGSRVLATWDQI